MMTEESKVVESKEQVVPESKVPESKVPESKVPESKVPESKVPESKGQATQEYSTSDIGLAGYLKLENMEVKEVAERRGRTVFVFIDREDRRGLVYGYFNKHAQVDALTYKNVLRDMKNFVINSL